MTDPLPGLTATEVRAARFGRPPLGRRGYHKGEVDALLDRAEAAIRQPEQMHR